MPVRLRSTRREATPLVLLCCLALLCDWTQCRAEAGAPGTSARPRIGLVLAGGGAKGVAHVGVLKVLDELNVPVD